MFDKNLTIQERKRRFEEFRKNWRLDARSRRPPIPRGYASLLQIVGPTLMECVSKNKTNIVRNTAKRLGVREYTAANLLYDFINRQGDIENKEDMLLSINVKHFWGEKRDRISKTSLLKIHRESEVATKWLQPPVPDLKLHYIDFAGVVVPPTVDDVLTYLELLSYASQFEVDVSDLRAFFHDADSISTFLDVFGLTWDQLPLKPLEYAKFEEPLHNILETNFSHLDNWQLQLPFQCKFIFYGNIHNPNVVTFDSVTDRIGKEYQEALGTEVVSKLIATRREGQGNEWMMYGYYLRGKEPNLLTLLTDQSIEDPNMHTSITTFIRKIPKLLEFEIQDMHGNGPIPVLDYIDLKR